MGFSFSSAAIIILLLFSSFVFALVSCSIDASALKGIDVENPVIDVLPTPVAGYASSDRRSTDVISCERVRVAGISRLKLRSYANAYRVTLAPSALIPEKLHTKIQICVHQNASLGLCQCEKDDWKHMHKGLWRFIMSPYEEKYIDVKFGGEVSGPVSVTVEEDFQRWRLLFLALGFILLLLAPIVSSWVPFYYSSSMAIGVLLVIIILLFQAMKLLPTGRKNVLYLTIYGSVLGAGSFLLHQFSVLVNSILLNFGLSEEMHNPVSIFVLVGIVIAGAALGYWLVRKFVVSEDGSVDVGVAHFVKWAMRIIAVTFIFQSTLDITLALAALVSCLAVYFSITSFKWQDTYEIPWFRNDGSAFLKRNRAEFLSRTGKMSSRVSPWSSPRKQYAWSDSPVKGLSLSPLKGMNNLRDYYSTFHRTPNRKKFTKEEWEKFTQESTRQAMVGLASSPEFTNWVMSNADRIQVVSDDSSDGTIGSGSDSTDENVASSDNCFSFFKW